MRILHLIDADSPCGVSPTTLALLEASLGRLGAIEQRVALLGGQRLRQAAADAGVRSDYAATVPGGRTWLGLPMAHRLTAQLGQFDLIHCWSIGALTLAALWQRNVPRLLSIVAPPSPRAVHWLRMLTLHSSGTTVLLPISHTLRRTLLSGGLPQAAVHVLRPGLDMGRLAFRERGAIRAAWGIGDEVRVVAVLSDPAAAGDARLPAMAVSLAADTRDDPPRPLRVLMHPEQRHRRRAAEMLVNLERGERLMLDENLACPWRVLPACDLALAIGPDAGGLSLLWAMAANIPVIAEARYAISEIVEDRHSALLAKPDHPPTLAHHLCRLLDDPQLAWKLRDTARHEAFSFFSRQRYCQSLAAVYQQTVAGQPVEVPAMEITGGLRFAGIA